MLDSKTLKEKFAPTIKVVEVKEWDDEVKIKRLTVKETDEYISVKKEKGDIPALYTAVSFCLVEPKMSADELMQLNEASLPGVEEIFTHLNEISKTKK